MNNGNRIWVMGLIITQLAVLQIYAGGRTGPQQNAHVDAARNQYVSCVADRECDSEGDASLRIPNFNKGRHHNYRNDWFRTLYKAVQDGDGAKIISVLESEGGVEHPNSIADKYGFNADRRRFQPVRSVPLNPFPLSATEHSSRINSDLVAEVEESQ